MYVIFQGESLLIPATVQGDKEAIEDLIVELKEAKPGGGVPDTDDPVVGILTIEDYDSPEVTDGYLFSLLDTSELAPGTYFVNYSYSVGDEVFDLGIPKKVIVKEGVV